MKIELIEQDREQFMELLLLGDEQESMVRRYLGEGEMFALYDGGLRAVSIVVELNDRECELKNIAVCEHSQNRGYGKAMINYISDYYSNRYDVMLVGTGENPSTVGFYESCGFRYSHRLKNFFTENYDHPIFENGVQLVDMLYLRKELI